MIFILYLMTTFGSSKVLISTEPIATLHISSVLVSDRFEILIFFNNDVSRYED